MIIEAFCHTGPASYVLCPCFSQPLGLGSRAVGGGVWAAASRWPTFGAGCGSPGPQSQAGTRIPASRPQACVTRLPLARAGGWGRHQCCPSDWRPSRTNSAKGRESLLQACRAEELRPRSAANELCDLGQVLERQGCTCTIGRNSPRALQPHGQSFSWPFWEGAVASLVSGGK